MAAAPISTQVNNDIENTRYYGTYETHLLSGGKIIIDENGCMLEKYYWGNSSNDYPYVTTDYTKMYIISSNYFSVDFSSSQYTLVSTNGTTRKPVAGDSLTVVGTVEERDEEYAPPRRYIISRGLSYWKDL